MQMLDCIKFSDMNSAIKDGLIIACGHTVQELFDYMKKEIDRVQNYYDFTSDINTLLNKQITKTTIK